MKRRYSRNEEIESKLHGPVVAYGVKWLGEKRGMDTNNFQVKLIVWGQHCAKRESAETTQHRYTGTHAQDGNRLKQHSIGTQAHTHKLSYVFEKPG